MVMEEPPSPESVGREFVRQYYTLLNKAPVHLHRFYNNASSFIHGGLEAADREVEPVIGQKEIHNRIQQLNFRDCHAKISQVDSQATLGNGVVVQVTGELSNGGQPMRRFTQTFVLASQSPRQYYVHNDIFRYQDFVFSEEDSDWGYGRGDDSAPQQPPPAALPAPYFPPPPVVASSAPSVLPNPAAIPPQPVHQEHATHNGHQEDGNLSIPMAVSDSSCGDVDVGGQDFEPEDETVTQATAAASFATPTPIVEPAPVVNTEPKTYANLVKTGFANLVKAGNHYVNNQSSINANVRLSSTQTRVESGPTAPTSTSTTPNVSANQHRPRPARTPRSESGDTGGSASGANQPAPSTGPGRRYSDSQQIFLGNLPHSATKDDLRQIFEKFGTILELRVNTKPTGPAGAGPANASGRVLPNYAFLIFEEPQSVQACLNAGPLYYPSADSPDAVVLNVQEKKSRPGAAGGGGGRGGAGGGARVHRTPGFNRRTYQPQRR